MIPFEETESTKFLDGVGTRLYSLEDIDYTDRDFLAIAGHMLPADDTFYAFITCGALIEDGLISKRRSFSKNFEERISKDSSINLLTDPITKITLCLIPPDKYFVGGVENGKVINGRVERSEHFDHVNNLFFHLNNEHLRFGIYRVTSQTLIDIVKSEMDKYRGRKPIDMHN